MAQLPDYNSYGTCYLSETVSETEFNTWAAKVAAAGDAEAAKQITHTHFAGSRNRGKKTKVLQDVLRGFIVKEKQLAAMAPTFEKLVKQVRKTVTDIQYTELTLDFFYKQVPVTEYTVTTKTGFYKFTVPSDTEILNHVIL